MKGLGLLIRNSSFAFDDTWFDLQLSVAHNSNLLDFSCPLHLIIHNLSKRSHSRSANGLSTVLEQVRYFLTVLAFQDIKFQLKMMRNGTSLFYVVHLDTELIKRRPMEENVDVVTLKFVFLRDARILSLCISAGLFYSFILILIKLDI